MDDFKQIVHRGLDKGASDMHLTVGLPPVYRIDGTLVNDGDVPLEEEDIVAAVRLLANEDQLKELKTAGADYIVQTTADILKII